MAGCLGGCCCRCDALHPVRPWERTLIHHELEGAVRPAASLASLTVFMSPDTAEGPNPGHSQELFSQLCLPAPAAVQGLAKLSMEAAGTETPPAQQLPCRGGKSADK